MSISVIDPIPRAWQRMMQVCFKRFDIGKWFVLGFCAWLAYLGEGGGGGFNFNFPTGGGGQPGSGPGGAGGFNPFDWVTNHLELVLGIGVVALIVILGITCLVYWLQARGKFMFLDGVVLNRGAIVEPWKQYRDVANSLFWFKFFMMLICVAVSFAALGGSLLIAFPDLQQGQFTSNGIWAILLCVFVFVPLMVVALLINLLLNDFIVPAMYLRKIFVLDAWGQVKREVFKGNFWTIVLFYLMRLVLGMAAATGVLLLYILTCCVAACIAAIPYLGTVLLLPILVFGRCYSLYFLQQFGPGWLIFGVDSNAPRCPGCDYDLRGNVAGESCPECGYLFPGGVLALPDTPAANP